MRYLREYDGADHWGDPCWTFALADTGIAEVKASMEGAEHASDAGAIGLHPLNGPVPGYLCGMTFPRIAFAAPTLHAWSETFIAAHLHGLRNVELVFAGGALVTRPGEPVPLLLTTRGHWWRNQYERRGLRLADEEMRNRRIAYLLKRDRIPDPMTNPMITGLIGTARKPAA
jgi:hypothetical protein